MGPKVRTPPTTGACLIDLRWGVAREKGFEPSNSYETRLLPPRVSGRFTREVLNLAPLTKLSHPRTGPHW
jgi:hypothetical protein